MAGPASYVEGPPPGALAGHVACVWWRTPERGSAGAPPRRRGLEGNGGVAAGPLKALPVDAGHDVLPDGCVDLVWHAGLLVVAGPDTGPTPSASSSATTIGVRLRPGAAAVLGESVGALRDLRVPVDALWGRSGAELAERVGSAPDDTLRLRAMVGAVGARIASSGPLDPAVLAAVDAIGVGGTPVAAVADRVGLSERQLRRRFVDHVGYGPKTLHRVLRLQRFLDEAIATDDALAVLALRAGYADQSHLARDARALAAATPAALVAARRPVGAAEVRPVEVSETSKTRRPPSTRMPA